MKQPTFFEGVAVALIASAAGAALLSVLGPVLGAGMMLRLLIAAIGFAYVIYLLRRSRERVGRVTVLVLWLIAAAVVWFLWPPILVYVVVHIGMIWLVRSLYFYSSVLPALADLGLNGLSLIAAIWAGMHTHSVFLSLWCFFLLQALFVAIPNTLRRKSKSDLHNTMDDRFECAHRAAQTAVQKLSSMH